MAYQGGTETDKLQRAGKFLETLYEEVHRLIDGGRQKQAIGALEMFLTIYPNYALPHNDLGILYYGEGDKEKALEHYEEAVRLDSDNAAFQKNLADFYYVEAGRLEDALQIYVKLLDANPTDIEILVILGQICVSLKKPDDARVFFNKALELEPWDEDAREKLDELDREQGLKGGGHWSGGGRFESAEKMYQDAQKLVNSNGDNEWIGSLERLLESHPDYGPAHNDLGVLYYNRGEKEKALAHYEKAARLDPDNATFQKNLADFYYIEAGRMGDALQIYVNLLEANPTDIETLLILGQICTAMKKPDETRVFLKKALELEPWNMDAQEKLDQLENVQRVASQVSEDEKKVNSGARTLESPEVLYREAQELIKSNQNKDAVAVLEGLTASYPDYALAHNDLGVLYFNEENSEKALEHYEKAARIEPQNAVFQKNLADFYYVASGRTEDALEIYLKLLEIKPTDIETLLIMGHICVSLKKFDDAEVFYHRTLELEPWNADAREKLDQLEKAKRSKGDQRDSKDKAFSVDEREQLPGWMKTDFEPISEDSEPVHDQAFQADSDQWEMSLILSSENAEHLILGRDEASSQSIDSEEIEIVFGEKESRGNERGVLKAKEKPSKNIIFLRSGKGGSPEVLETLKFVAEKFNRGETAADIKKEIMELSSSGAVAVSDPDVADRFIELFDRLTGALKGLAEPFQTRPVEVEEAVAVDKEKVEEDRNSRDARYREEILNRIVEMKDEKALGWREIADAFNSEGLPTFSGKGKWHRKTVFRMYQKRVK